MENTPATTETAAGGESIPTTGAPGPAPLGRQAKAVVALVVVAALAALFWPRGKEDRTAPGGFLVDSNGRPVTLATRMAPVTLVHFWATWCPPCMTEIPALRRLVDDFSGDRQLDVVMIAVNDKVQNVEPFLGSLARMALFDPSWDVAHRYGTEKLPETYLIVNGKVAEKWVGATDWDDPSVRSKIRTALTSVGATRADLDPAS